MMQDEKPKTLLNYPIQKYTEENEERIKTPSKVRITKSVRSIIVNNLGV